VPGRDLPSIPIEGCRRRYEPVDEEFSDRFLAYTVAQQSASSDGCELAGKPPESTRTPDIQWFHTDRITGEPDFWSGSASVEESECEHPIQSAE
jgi:hypothetical protein